MRLIAAAIAAPVVGFAAGLLGTLAIGPANAGLENVLARISLLRTAHQEALDVQPPARSQLPDRPSLRVVASLEPQAAFAFAAEETDRSGATLDASFRQPVLFEQRLISFKDRFSGEVAPPESAPDETVETPERTDDTPPPAPDSRGNATARNTRSGMKLASLSPVGAAKSQIRAANASKDGIPGVGSKTAIYDIVAHTVYMPDGRRLEAHSGLGSQMDDPRYINVKSRGPTPPNVYDLTLREELFHGVRAIRLNPVDDGKMFGRDGILAHTYMLGPNGQSNGCVSFSDYPAFLNAFLRGEVDRIVVVEHLQNAPPASETASGWIPEGIMSFFRRS